MTEISPASIDSPPRTLDLHTAGGGVGHLAVQIRSIEVLRPDGRFITAVERTPWRVTEDDLLIGLLDRSARTGPFGSSPSANS